MAERVIEILKNKYLLSFIRYEGLQRIEGLEIPEDALREAIFNSIIHKNYAGVAIQMKIWNDRIELWNDGEFPFGLTAEDLKNGRKSKPRNRNIANAFYKAGFVESWGRGIKKICIEFSQSGLPEPVFENFCGGVNVTIPRNNPEVNEFSAEYQRVFGNNETTRKLDNVPHKTDDDLENDLENEIYEILKSNSKSTYLQIADKTKKSEATVKRAISNMKKNGIIKRIGPDKGGKWKIIKNDTN